VPYILASQGPNIDPLITRIDYWKIDSITGLPPGTMYVCEPDNCIFEDTTGCVSITGQPTVAGTFFPIIHTMVRAPTVLGTVSIPVNLPTLPSDIGGFEGAYQIDICSDKMCGSCIVGVNDTPKRTLNIQQNSPNPFWRNTNIIIHSKESDTFDFHVVNMMGKIIHNEQVYLFLGENNILFNGSKFPSGMYFYSIGKNGNYTFKKMMISGKK